MVKFGNPKPITHREAYEDSIARDYTMVSVDSMVYRFSGAALQVQHIVCPDGYWELDDPIAYEVEIIRPIWLYGSEGHLFPLEFIGRLSDDWLDIYQEDWFPGEDNDPFPDAGSYLLWALPNRHGPDRSVPWKEVGWPRRDFFTDAPWGAQPKPCMSEGGQSCGQWIYCDLPSGHDGCHAAWCTMVDGRASRTMWD